MSKTNENANHSNRLLIASDHAGFKLKEELIQSLPQYDWVDLGPSNDERVDYPDFADRLVEELKKSGGRGVLLCGSGQGMAIRANRDCGIRAALVWSEDSARLAREHNDANVLCIGSRFSNSDLSQRMISIFMSTPFEGGRHQSRVEKLGRNV